MTIPDNIRALADDLGLPAEKLLEAVASDEQLMTRIEHKLRPFDLMGRGTRLRPEELASELAARVWCGEGVLYARLPEYDEDFTEAMHRQDLSWDRSKKRWERPLRPWHGSLRDRLVELCCEVLAAGFACEIPTEDLEGDVLSGRYEPEHTRWVLCNTSGDYEGWFVVIWNRDVEDLYEEARALPGSRYDKPRVVAPADAYEAVYDFAERYDFRLSESARALAEAAEEKEAADLIARPARPQKEAADAEQDLDPENVDQEVADALKDDG